MKVDELPTWIGSLGRTRFGYASRGRIHRYRVNNYKIEVPCFDPKVSHLVGKFMLDPFSS